MEIKWNMPPTVLKHARVVSPFIFGFMVWVDDDNWSGLFLKEQVPRRYELRLLVVLTIAPQELVFQSNKTLVDYSHQLSVTFDLAYFAGRIDL